MSLTNYPACAAAVRGYEGGFTVDQGGPTMHGVTLTTFSTYLGRTASVDELKAISDTQVDAIYHGMYWDTVQADALPSGLDLVAFDASINSGPHRSAILLQEGLVVPADGVIGPMTIAAAAASGAAAINAACDARLRFLQSLSTWPTDQGGWTARVASVRATALAMQSAAAVVVKPTPAPSVSIPQPKGQPMFNADQLNSLVRTALTALATLAIAHGVPAFLADGFANSAAVNTAIDGIVMGGISLVWSYITHAATPAA